ncbi:MAG: hypothetical protein J2P25_15040 [Nocardiopsaceae bacterium]|nr:hypothetical protein [Nocardiopsaceae bacterium]
MAEVADEPDEEPAHHSFVVRVEEVECFSPFRRGLADVVADGSCRRAPDYAIERIIARPIAQSSVFEF